MIGLHVLSTTTGERGSKVGDAIDHRRDVTALAATDDGTVYLIREAVESLTVSAAASSSATAPTGSVTATCRKPASSAAERPLKQALFSM